jgi:hypothetical protein
MSRKRSQSNDPEGAVTKRLRLKRPTLRGVALAVLFAVALLERQRIAQLRALVDAARGGDRRGGARVKKRRRGGGDDDGDGDDEYRRCSQCEVLRPLKDFGKRANTGDGRSLDCLLCQREYDKARRGMLRREMQVVVSHIRAEDRKKSRSCNVTVDYLLDLLWKQRGRCAYSRRAANLVPNTEWRCSLERINNNTGHVKGNVLFVCREFNTPNNSRNSTVHRVYGTAQWSRQKFLAVPTLAKKPLDLELLHREISVARVGGRRGGGRRKRRQHDGGKHRRCSRCEVLKSLSDFDKKATASDGLQSYCKSCKQEDNDEYRRTLRGSMKSAMSTVSNHDRGKNRSCNMSLDYLLDLLWRQRGRCAISLAPLDLVPNTDWRCSLERINNNTGHVKGNVLFICREFNTPDNSRNNAVHEVHGTAQWTREKFLECWYPYVCDA